MNLFDKILALFIRAAEPPRTYKPGPKFVEGTEWTCPKCEEVLGVAQYDIFSGTAMGWRQWNTKRDPRWHCGIATMRDGPNGRHEIHTPTGWVG